MFAECRGTNLLNRMLDHHLLANKDMQMGKLRLVLEMEDINRLIAEFGYSGYGRVTGIEEKMIRAHVHVPGVPGEYEIWLANFGVKDNHLSATNWSIKLVVGQSYQNFRR